MGSRWPPAGERVLDEDLGAFEPPDADPRRTFERLAVATLLVFAGFVAIAGLTWTFGPAGGVVGAAVPPVAATWRARR